MKYCHHATSATEGTDAELNEENPGEVSGGGDERLRGQTDIPPGAGGSAGEMAAEREG